MGWKAQNFPDFPNGFSRLSSRPEWHLTKSQTHRHWNMSTKKNTFFEAVMFWRKTSLSLPFSSHFTILTAKAFGPAKTEPQKDPNISMGDAGLAPSFFKARSVLSTEQGFRANWVYETCCESQVIFQTCLSYTDFFCKKKTLFLDLVHPIY